MTIDFNTCGIGLLGLSGYEADAARLERALTNLTRQRPYWRVAPEPGAQFQRFAATDRERVNALETLMADPQVGLIMAVRGGYGLSRLLPALDFAAIAAGIRSGYKRYVGHSDFTAFHLALYARTGAVSFAGPMASYDFGGHGPAHALSDYTVRHFTALMAQGTHHVSFPAAGPRCATDGTLWGGNLALCNCCMPACCNASVPYWSAISRPSSPRPMTTALILMP